MRDVCFAASLWLGAVVASCVTTGAPPATTAPPALKIESQDRAMNAGRAARYDVLFAIDRSESTREPSGQDLNGDGHLSCQGFERLRAALVGYCDHPEDSVLAAELIAVRTLLAQLDPHTTQVGIVSFGGDGVPETPDAELHAPLTSDYGRILQALDAVQTAGPAGRTNLQEALSSSANEILRARAEVDPAQRADGLIFLLSDGMPTLPDNRSMRLNRALAGASASTAASAGIRLYIYGIGPEMTEPSTRKTGEELARAGSGSFTRVIAPSELKLVLEGSPQSEPERAAVPATVP